MRNGVDTCCYFSERKDAYLAFWFGTYSLIGRIYKIKS